MHPVARRSWGRAVDARSDEDAHGYPSGLFKYGGLLVGFTQSVG